MEKKDVFGKFLKTIPEDINIEIDLSFDIATRVQSLLDKHGMTQKDLALRLGKKESEISKWLHGSHNFTIRTIAKLSAALNEEIIMTADKSNRAISAYIFKPITSPISITTSHQNSGIQFPCSPDEVWVKCN